MRLAIILCLLLITTIARGELQDADDEELDAAVGQSFFDLSKQALAQPGGGDLTFIKLMLGGQMKVNANIGEVNLGPTGSEFLKLVNVSLSGGSGPGSVMTLQNPFVEFAMENDNGTSNRRLVGLRIGANNMNGVLGIGFQTNNGTDNGIARFHGYLRVRSDESNYDIRGTANTNPFYFNKNVTARVEVDNGVNGKFTTDVNPNDPGFYVGAMNVPFAIPGGIVVNTASGPITSVNVNASAAIPTIGIDGDARFTNIRDKDCPWWNLIICNIVIGLVPSAKPTLHTSVQNLGANFSMQEDLRFLHKAILSGNGAALSLQSRDVLWPNSADGHIAKPGWWLGVSNPLNIGTLNVTTPIVITDGIQNQLATQMSNYLMANPVKLSFSEALNALAGGDIYVPALNMSGTSINVSQNNLNLGASQTHPSNCYGGRSFC